MSLFGVQLEALRRGADKHGFAYFMEQGLGKTLTALTDFADKVAKREATRLVVVCPNSFKGGWKAEIATHGFDYDVFVWEAGMERYLKSWITRGFKKPPVLIVNYDAVRSTKVKRGKKVEWVPSTLAQVIEEHFAVVNSMVVFDESIQAATHDSATSIGCQRMSRIFAFRRILSGKPIRQGPHDLWAQFRMIGQLEGRNYFSFKAAFCKTGGYMNKQITGAQNEDILAEMIEPHLFRATKADWTDLPPKLYSIREYKLTKEMYDMYKAMRDEFVLWLNAEENVAVDAAITKYIKLAQIQCGWIYDEQGNVRWLVEDSKNPRLNLLKEIIDTEVTGKVAIPYNHRPVFDQLMRNLGGEANCAYIRGNMKPEEVEEQKRRFNKDPNVRIILLQTRASKYGHTLLGDQTSDDLRCNTMIPYENTYSLDDRSQIEDRSHRHGQLAESMLYVDLVGTQLDRDCVRALQRKESVFQSVFAPLRSTPARST